MEEKFSHANVRLRYQPWFDWFIYLYIFAKYLKYEQRPFVYSKLPPKMPFKINCVKANLDHKASITSSCGKNLTQERTNGHKKA